MSEKKRNVIEAGVQDDKKDILSQPIANIITNTRSRNCLLENGIYTIEDLIKKTQEEIKLIEGIGEESFHNILVCLHNYGLHLGNRYDIYNSNNKIGDKYISPGFMDEEDGTDNETT